MGNCLSGAPARLIQDINGNEEDYHCRFIEDEILGEGEFGQVRMVHDMKKDGKNGKNDDKSNNVVVPYACKLLRKGVVFKDNTLYSPIKPAVLRGEVEMLRCLQGKEYCMKLIAIYETPRVLYMITEYCGGGEMMEYVSHLPETSGLTIVQVSRIAFQLLSALHHCATHKVIHRDVKPENVMFQDPTPSAEIRLIDFGSGTFIHPTPEMVNHKTNNVAEDETDDLRVHTTFAGSAFYISPEMFQHSYTYKTDVWSAGATLYVLVAGYPADKLQKAFNILQTNKHRKLRDLPNLPLDDLPNSFFTLLEGLLTYRHKSRPSAGEMRRLEFCQLHKKQQQAATTTETEAQQEENVYMEDAEEPMGLSLEQVSAAAAAAGAGIMAGGGGSTTLTKVGRLSLAGTAGRHQLFLGFKKYERSLTALLAAVLSKTEFAQLLVILKKRQVLEQTNTIKTAAATHGNNGKSNNNNKEQEIIIASSSDQASLTASAAAASLSVIPVRELKLILQEDICNEQVIATMEKLPGAELYDGFAYHVALLREFAMVGAGDDLSESSNLSASGRKRLRRRTQLRRNLSFSGNPGGGSARGGNMFVLADDSSLNGSVSGSVQGGRRNINNKRRDLTVNSTGSASTSQRSTNKKLSSTVSGGRLFASSSRGR